MLIFLNLYKIYLILNFPELTEYYELFLLNNNNKKTNRFKFGEQITTKYNTETGGEIILLNNSFFQYESKYNNKIIVKNGKLLFIPLENYKIEKCIIIIFCVFIRDCIYYSESNITYQFIF